jgi:hypothetical protein
MSSRVRAGAQYLKLVTEYTALGILKHLVPIHTLARWAWAAPVRDRDPRSERVLVARVQRLARWFRTDRDCLQRSLVLYRELSRAGAAPILQFGFRQSATGVDGHAWVSTDGVVLGEVDPTREYSTAIAFGPDGRVVNRS